MSVAEHLVACTRQPGSTSLIEPERASRLWQHLREAFPEALSCVLMPDHLHLVTDTASGWLKLRRVLAGLAATSRSRFHVFDPQPVNTLAIAKRTLRYTFHNPVRARYVDDPWAWPYSTLRDLTGAVHQPWTEVGTLLRLFGGSRESLLRVLTTTAEFRPVLPVPLTAGVASVAAIRDAVAAACRIPRARVASHRMGRRLSVQAHLEIGSGCVACVAKQLEMPRRTIRYLSTPRHPALDAVLLCLGDARLRNAVS